MALVGAGRVDDLALVGPRYLLALVGVHEACRLDLEAVPSELPTLSLPMVPNWLVTSVPDDVVAWKEPST